VRGLASCRHDSTVDVLVRVLKAAGRGARVTNFEEKISQLGSYGGGNHFGEAEVVHVRKGMEGMAETFGCSMAASHSCRTAARAALVISWRIISSRRCKHCFAPGPASFPGKRQRIGVRAARHA